MPRALLSVSDKTGIVTFARSLAARGFELISTGGTAHALIEAGLSVVAIADVTGFPELMDGRVKTLHPAVHGGILARRDRVDDLNAARQHGIGLIDLVAVNLYPFVRTAADPHTSFDALVEQIDIGGPSLVRSAAKNFRDVLVVVDPSDYPSLLHEIDQSNGSSLEYRFDLARKAFAHTAAYDAAISGVLDQVRLSLEGFVRVAESPGDALPGKLTPTWRKLRDLRYGENPHQRGAWYAADERHGLSAATIVQGKELSYTNLLDLDAAARLVFEFDEPAAAMIKHTNPSGVATGRSAAEAYLRAREADTLAAFGGIVALNRLIDVDTARAMTSTFLEAVIAPAVEEDARRILAGKPKMRVVVGEMIRAASRDVLDRLEVRSILGGVLAQERDCVLEARFPWATGAGTAGEGLARVVTQREPSAVEWEALRFAWRVCAHVKSNAIVFADRDCTRAIGAGQMSRVDAVKVAVLKATERQRAAPPLAGTVAASDAFFPFPDGVEAIAAAGATAIVQPGGSVRDGEVIATANACGLAMIFTGRRHFRH